MSVLDYIFDKRTGRIVHLGLKGVRGWDPLEPCKVELPAEYDFVVERVKPLKAGRRRDKRR